jgi:hypothetical protein
MYIGLHVNIRYSLQILIKFSYSRQIFEKYSNIKLLEFRPVEGDRRRDIQKDKRTSSRFVAILRRHQIKLRIYVHVCIPISDYKAYK